MIKKPCLICKNIYKVRNDRTSKYCSRTCFNISKKGKPAWNKGIDHLSAEAKKRIGLAAKKRFKEFGHPKGMKGKTHTKENKDRISKTLLAGRKRKNKYPQGYKYGHIKVRLVRGKPEICEFCGKKGIDWANLTGKFEDPYDYKSACRSCHKKLDKVYLRRKRNKLGQFK